MKDVFKALWKDFSHRLEQIIFEVKSHTALIEDEIGTLVNPSPGLQTDMRHIRDHIQQMEQKAHEFEKKEIERKKKMYTEVRDWLISADIEREHFEYCHDRESYPNTGDWILSHGKVKKWLSQDPEQSSHSILWINGRPGTGIVIFSAGGFPKYSLIWNTP